MKRAVSWGVILLITILISTILFITGRLHKVMLTNGKKGEEEVPKVIEYSIDKAPFKKVRAFKKGATEIKGMNHTIVIRFEDLNGEKKEITKKFKAKIRERENIELFKLIKNENDWLIYTSEKEPKKQVVEQTNEPVVVDSMESGSIPQV